MIIGPLPDAGPDGNFDCALQILSGLSSTSKIIKGHYTPRPVGRFLMRVQRLNSHCGRQSNVIRISTGSSDSSDGGSRCLSQSSQRLFAVCPRSDCSSFGDRAQTCQACRLHEQCVNLQAVTHESHLASPFHVKCLVRRDRVRERTSETVSCGSLEH